MVSPFSPARPAGRISWGAALHRLTSQYATLRGRFIKEKWLKFLELVNIFYIKGFLKTGNGRIEGYLDRCFDSLAGSALVLFL